MPASALFMGAAWSRKVLALAVLSSGVMGLTVGGEVGSYQLGVEYHGDNFFDGFQFFTVGFFLSRLAWTRSAEQI